MKDNWIYASVPREAGRGRLLFMAMSQEFFTNMHVYFCSKKKHGENSAHPKTLNILAVRRVCARKAFSMQAWSLNSNPTMH